MTTRQILFLARFGQALTAALFLMTVIAAIRPGTFNFSRWTENALLLGCVTAPLAFSAYLSKEYRPWTRPYASSDMLLNGRALSWMILIGSIAGSLLFMGVGRHLEHRDMVQFGTIFLALIMAIEWISVRSWVGEMYFRGELE